MRHRGLGLPGTLAMLLACVTLASEPSVGQAQTGSSTGPRTTWGEPDLQGVWRNDTETPLERPPELAGKEFYTEEEATALAEERCGSSGHLSCQDGRAAAEGPSPESATQPAGTYNRFWQDRGKAVRVVTRTSMITGPNGRIPFTPQMKQESDRVTANYGTGPFDTWRDVELGERCHTDGLPGSVWTGTAGGPQKISQSPGWVVIQGEQFRDRRIVPTDVGTRTAVSDTGSAKVSADGRATRWSSRRRTSSTSPMSVGSPRGVSRPRPCGWSSASPASTPRRSCTR